MKTKFEFHLQMAEAAAIPIFDYDDEARDDVYPHITTSKNYQGRNEVILWLHPEQDGEKFAPEDNLNHFLMVKTAVNFLPDE